MDTRTVDEIVTWNDARGMRSLLAVLGGSPIERAAELLLQQSAPLAICTGFPVQGHAESDGPPGAVLLARALRCLGKEVSIVSFRSVLTACSELLDGFSQIELSVGRAPEQLVDMPVVTIEVCGRVAGGRYENMHGEDIVDRVPWLEDALLKPALVSIGDGGNEHGMGSAPATWFETRNVKRPVSTCDALAVGQVSNWAALAVIAVMSRRRGIPLLPNAEDYQTLLDRLAARGVVDGATGKPTGTEDGQERGAGPAIVEQLQRWVAA